MPMTTAKIAIRKIVEFVDRKRKINFIWHGGEPLLVGSDFFIQISEFSKEFGTEKIEHCIQTNGAFLKADFLKFCYDNNIAISLSFDGPETIHDTNRRDKSGKGTHYKTMEAIQKIKDIGLTAGCVCVLHKQNVCHIEELYGFFKTNKINFRINPVVRSGKAIINYNNLAVHSVEYGNAMKKLFDLWFFDNCDIQVEPLNTIVGNFVSPYIWGCDYHGDCLKNIISINPDGSIYPCGRFAGLERFRLGNIIDDSIHSITNTSLFKELSNRNFNTVKECIKCVFKDICNGGCMITAHMARGNIYDPDYYCKGRKILFSHIANELQRSIEKAAVMVN
jgi:uncharacterized protein